MGNDQTLRWNLVSSLRCDSGTSNFTIYSGQKGFGKHYMLFYEMRIKNEFMLEEI